MPLFNIFSDPQLRARQDQLDAQWKALNAAQSGCSSIPDTAWVEWVNDFRNWQEFYDSGSDWSSDSFNATNVWQQKLKEWSARMATYGCVGSLGSVGGEDIPAGGDQGIPGVKEPPPDEKSTVEKVGDEVTGVVGSVSTFVKTASWVAIGLIVVVLIATVYTLTHVKASHPSYGSIG